MSGLQSCSSVLGARWGPPRVRCALRRVVAQPRGSNWCVFSPQVGLARLWLCWTLTWTACLTWRWEPPRWAPRSSHTRYGGWWGGGIVGAEAGAHGISREKQEEGVSGSVLGEMIPAFHSGPCDLRLPGRSRSCLPGLSLAFRVGFPNSARS